MVRPDPLTDEMEVVIREVLAGNYFPKYDPEDTERLESVSICWQIPVKPETEGEKVREWYQREELHTPGLIQNKLYKLTKDESAPDRYRREEIEPGDVDAAVLALEYQDEVETGIDEIPIVHVPNNEMTEEMPWGTSDYVNAEHQQRTLNERATDHRHMLRKWSDPLIAVPLSHMLQEEGRKKSFNAYQNKAVTYTPGEEVPKYISVPLENFPHSDTEATKTLQRLCWTIGISPESIGLTEGNYPESGRAIRLRQAETLSTVARKWVSLEPGLKHILAIALKLAAKHAGGPKPVEPEDIEIEHGDGLVEDERERLEELQLKKALGVSKEQILRELYPKWDDKAIQEELKRAEAEKPKLPVMDGRPGAPNANPQGNVPPNAKGRVQEMGDEAARKQDRETK